MTDDPIARQDPDPPFPREAMLAQWDALGRPKITISQGAVIYDLGKYLDGWVNPADLDIIKLALIQQMEV
jgi:hypothetical protein